MEGQITMLEAEETQEYRDFVEKFKPKKTTDDCYTPENIYDAVADWVAKEYGVDRSSFVRPFWPGGDYERFDYPDGCVVVDNPPFSILSRICKWYAERGIRFFLFAPALSLFSTAAGTMNYVVCGVQITYENGAKVNTSFVTNMGEYKILCSHALNEIMTEADRKNVKAMAKSVPVYDYPPNVCTGARLSYLANHGVDLRIRAMDAHFIRALDSQRKNGKALYGGGFLLSDHAAAEKAAAEKAAAQYWPISERERTIIDALG